MMTRAIRRLQVADETLADVLDWTTYEVVAGLAATHVPVRIGTAGDSGPVGVLTASVHGDEGPWSTIAINRMLSRVRASELTGTLRVVPVANPLATEADARQAELDPLDLNNSFGGDANGTHTQRLARLLADKALDGSDVVLDVHGGGSWNVNCFTYRFPGSHELADWMRTPLICDGPDRPTSLTGYARGQGATAVWIEMGGRGEWEDERIEAVATGLRHALGRAGILTPVDAEGADPLVASGMTAFATSAPGIYQPVIRERGLATVVGAGTLIGELLDPVSSQVIQQFTAPYERSCLALLRPTIARIEAPGKVVAVAADVTEATRG
jgi:predicted deacylase